MGRLYLRNLLSLGRGGRARQEACLRRRVLPGIVEEIHSASSTIRFLHPFSQTCPTCISAPIPPCFSRPPRTRLKRTRSIDRSNFSKSSFSESCFYNLNANISERRRLFSYRTVAIHFDLLARLAKGKIISFALFGHPVPVYLTPLI